MKIIVILLTTAILQVSASTYGQNVTLKQDNAKLVTVLNEISKQTGYDFFYNEQLINKAKPVNINLKNVNIESALEICFKDQPLSYTIENKIVTVKEKSSFLEKILDRFNNIDVRGYVVDETDSPIPGATVRVKGTNRAMMTDGNGEFFLKNVDDQAVVEVTVVGYNKAELTIAQNMNNPSKLLLVKLTVASAKLDEVQVIAYGTTSQRLSTGNVASVGAREIAQQPVNNPLLALEGSVPGLFITQSSGMPGAGVGVSIQGRNSISFGNDPFYVIDGVPYVSQLLPSVVVETFLGTSGNGFSRQNGNPLNYLNPGDIESISVLKGGDATAIYGSRAANGAILITTKKGKPGNIQVNLNAQQGWGQVPHMMELMNTPQYLQMRREALKNDGLSPSLANGDYDLMQWDTTRYTNWQKKLIGGTSHYSDYSASVSGGMFNTQYLIGSTFHRETSVFPGNFADRKGSVHFNVNSASANQRFKVQLSGNYMLDDNKLPGASTYSFMFLALGLAPNAPEVYNPDGSLNWAPNASGASTWTNPLSQLLNTYSNTTNNLIGNMVLSYNILPGLTVSNSLGYTSLQAKEIIEQPLGAHAPEALATQLPAAGYTNNSISSWIVEPQINYTRLLGKGKLEALLGSTIQQQNSHGQILYGFGYTSDELLGDIGSAQTVYTNPSTMSTYKYNALFGRINYNWADKYLINLTGRRDGSSRFGRENEFHDFGAIGGGWIFSNEELIKKGCPFLSFAKIRASYGTTGNDQIGDYTFLSQYVAPIGVNVPYQGAGGLTPNGLPNPFLQWELTKKIDLGLDLGFFKDRISLSSTYYRNRSSNQLIGYGLSYVTGFSSITTNLPATVENSGWEFALRTTNLQSPGFTWSSNFNLTVPTNKLIAYPNLEASSYANVYVIGQPITITTVYHALGVNPVTGLYEFAGASGPTSNPGPKDKTAIVNTAPKFYGGFQNSFSYKGFRLDILLQFVKQTGPNLLAGSLGGLNYGSFNFNAPAVILERWQKPEDIAPYQKLSSNYDNFNSAYAEAQSDAAYSDASYIRLKNLSLSWQLPKTWQSKIHVQNARLFVQGQNLLTITKYKGMDPENQTYLSLPPLRVFTMGIEIGL